MQIISAIFIYNGTINRPPPFTLLSVDCIYI